MKYESVIALRYLKSSRQSFLSTITIISTIGVLLGVTALTAVVSVSGGFQKAYRERVLGVYPHIMLWPTDSRFSEYRQVMEAVRGVPGVTGVSPFVRQPLMIYSREGRAMVVARGIDLTHLEEVSQIDQYILPPGRITDLTYDPYGGPAALPGVLLGAELARKIGAEVGGPVTLVSHLRGIGDALGPSQMAPTSTRFRVAGTFQVGYHDFDSMLILTDIRALQDFINRGDVVTGLDIRTDDLFATAQVSQEITANLPASGYQALTWQELHKNLFASLKLQKVALAIVMTFIVIVASFNIISTLVMMVIDKTREIAILKSMGATNNGIMRIFIRQGLAIGLAGTALGLAGGVGVCKIIEQINFGLKSEVYKISTLPVDMRLEEFVIIALVSVAISFVATLYPSFRAGKLSPVEGLRY
ncbi:MAG: ABC transporter permease [Bradymonadales bacterium]|nr:ABC transporter permease [Bradymonadales bacterium]